MGEADCQTSGTGKRVDFGVVGLWACLTLITDSLKKRRNGAEKTSQNAKTASKIRPCHISRNHLKRKSRITIKKRQKTYIFPILQYLQSTAFLLSTYKGNYFFPIIVIKRVFFDTYAFFSCFLHTLLFIVGHQEGVLCRFGCRHRPVSTL